MRTHYFFCLLCILALTSCGDRASQPRVSLPEGYYLSTVSTDTTSVLVFPEGQHDGQYVSTLYLLDSVQIATRPEAVMEYNDSSGTGALYVMDEVIDLRTNGRDTLWLTSDAATKVYVRQPAAKHTPQSLAGEWKLSYRIDDYLSIRLMDATISDHLVCNMTFNIPDSAELAEMMASLGEQADSAYSDSLTWAQMLPDDLPWGQVLSSLPTSGTADIWYSAYAGSGVLLPDTKDLTIDIALPFTTPNGNTLRFSAGNFHMDMTRKK